MTEQQLRQRVRDLERCLVTVQPYAPENLRRSVDAALAGVDRATILRVRYASHGLTRRERETVLWLDEYHQNCQHMPTMEETAQHFGISKTTVFERITRLVYKGVLERTPHKANGTRFVEMNGAGA